MAFTVSQASLIPPLLVFAVVAVWVLLFGGLILALRNRSRGPSGSTTVTIIVFAVGLAALTAWLGYGALQRYAGQSPWTFSYSVSILSNGTSPEAVVVPIPTDERLLAGLRLSNGTANWSLVDTPNGRGLHIDFTGSASLRVDVTLSPAPYPVPNAGPTLEVPYVASVSEYRWWIFYDGQAGGVLDMSLGCYDLHAYLIPGWNTAQPWCPNPPLPPVA